MAEYNYVLAPTEQGLTTEQLEMLEEQQAAFKKQFLQSFHKTRDGTFQRKSSPQILPTIQTTTPWTPHPRGYEAAMASAHQRPMAVTTSAETPYGYTAQPCIPMPNISSLASATPSSSWNEYQGQYRPIPFHLNQSPDDLIYPSLGGQPYYRFNPTSNQGQFGPYNNQSAMYPGLADRSPNRPLVSPYQTPATSLVRPDKYQSQYEPIPFNLDQSACTQTSPTPGGQGYQPIGQSLAEVIGNAIREEFGLKPKSRSAGYKQPYPEEMDLIPYPMGYQIPEFTKFDGQGSISAFGHTSRFFTQCGEPSLLEAHRIRLFPLSLSGPALSWFSALPADSILTWVDLMEKFQERFSPQPQSDAEVMSALRKRNGEKVEKILRRFENTKNRNSEVKLPKSRLGDLSKEKLAEPIVEGPTSAEESRCTENEEVKECTQDQVIIEECTDGDTIGKTGVHVVEWSKESDEQLTRSWIRESEPEAKYSFKVDKTEQIFDFLLQNKKIQLANGHKIPSAEEIGDRKYCKWHHTYSHDTVRCNVFRRQVQSAINKGRLRFEDEPAISSKAGLTSISTSQDQDEAKANQVIEPIKEPDHLTTPTRVMSVPMESKALMLNNLEKVETADTEKCIFIGGIKVPIGGVQIRKFVKDIPKIGRCFKSSCKSDSSADSQTSSGKDTPKKKIVWADEFNVGTSVKLSDRHKPMLPRWCPGGLTKSQKRRLQRVRSYKLKGDAHKEESDESDSEVRLPTAPASIWRQKLVCLGRNLRRSIGLKS